ncbi:hypothetical protein [Streptomyces sp. NPDC088748]|uniref:hypothetical protein n=1 Tax=Streptomyces sp. NPDC088748 TaxID=3365887 RepID=UPI0037FDDCBB
MAERPVGDIFTALGGQTDVVPGTDAAALNLPGLADPLQAVLDQRKLLPARIQELLQDHPHPKAPRTMPGIGISTGARNLIDVGDGSSFPFAAHPAPAPDCDDVRVRSGRWPDPRYDWPWCLAFDLSATVRGGTRCRWTGGRVPIGAFARGTVTVLTALTDPAMAAPLPMAAGDR